MCPIFYSTELQEELENLGHIPGVDLCFLTPDAFTSLPPGAVIGKIPPTTKTQTEAESSTNELSTGGAETDKAEGEEGRSQLLVQDIEERREFERKVVPIKPPTHLFKTPQLHPLHIFVSKTLQSTELHVCVHVHHVHLCSI